MGLLSVLVFLPLLALVAVGLLPKRWAQGPFWLALGAVMAQVLLAAAWLLPTYVAQLPQADVRNVGFFIWESAPWLKLNLGSSGWLSIRFELGLDGLNILLVLLALVVLAVATLASRSQALRPRAYFRLLLLLNTALLGCFLAQDFLLFFLFYEFTLLPLFFLIGLWGGARSGFAALKFFLFTLAGSVFMLLVLAGLFFSTLDPVATALEAGLAQTPHGAAQKVAEVQRLAAEGRLAPHHMVHTLSLPMLQDPANLLPNSLMADMDVRWWAFLAMFIAFAVKLPVVPIHTWLPDAHVEASTPISVILAGVLLKVGGYGLIRLAYGLFPDVAIHQGHWVGAVAVASTLFPALVALAQTDLKRMVAYSSISHMGLALLGIASLQPEGLNGALFQMFNHGIVSASLFLLVGVVYGRVHSRDIGHFQGLWARMPRYTLFVAIAFFAGLGLPGFGLFISELLVFIGAFSAQGAGMGLPRWYALAAIPVIALSAAYFLRAFRRMFFGPWRTGGGPGWDARLADLSAREFGVLAILAALTLLPGLLPHWFLNLTDGTVAHWLKAILPPAD